MTKAAKKPKSPHRKTDNSDIEAKVRSEERLNDFLGHIMDTADDKQRFSMLPALSGIINIQGEDVFYHTVFAEKQGRYTPVVATSQGRLCQVRDNAVILLAQSQDVGNKNYKDTDGEPLYKKISDVPVEERYQFFEESGVRYKYTQPVFWNLDHGIQLIDNTAIHDVVNRKEYTKQIFNDNKAIVRDYFYHPNEYEYDVLCTADIVSYIKDVLGNVFYLCMYGGMGTGKSVGICLLSFLQYHGYFTGKGTVPSSCRLLHYFGIALNQDEFEKMRQDERNMLVCVFNTGLNSYGRYTLTNMGARDMQRQAIALRTFGMKSFTCNDLGGFDASFIDRLYVVLSVKTNKSLKNIYRLNTSELKRFQEMRNKLFVYCLFNWRQMRDDIDGMRATLETKNVFGREIDKNSIILGIVKHFLGDNYAAKVQAYIEKKAPVSQLEHFKTMEYIILETIVDAVDIKEKKLPAFIDVSNEDLYRRLLSDLECQEDDKYAPSNTKPRKILDALGLTCLKENIGMAHGGSRVYHIRTSELVAVLKSNSYDELMNKLFRSVGLTTPSTPTTLTKNGEGGEGIEGGEDVRPDKPRNISEKKYKSAERAEPIQYNRVKAIKEYCQKNKSVKRTLLDKKFNPTDVQQLIETRQLERIPTKDKSEKYKWYSSEAI